jgi:hypothetical protein
MPSLRTTGQLQSGPAFVMLFRDYALEFLSYLRDSIIRKVFGSRTTRNGPIQRGKDESAILIFSKWFISSNN